MSSHHIVREKQEPALLIEDLEGFDEEYFGQLLEWSPTVLVAADSYDRLTSMGIKSDILINTNGENQDYAEEHLKELSGTQVIETALKYLITEKYGAVNIISSYFLAKDYYFFIDKIDLVIYTGNFKIYPVKSGYSKWQTVGESIFLLEPSSALTVTEGLKLFENDQSQSNYDVLPGNFHHYKTIKDGFFCLFFEQHFIFIAEKLD